MAYVACALLFYKYYLNILAWIQGLGWLAPVFFIVIYCGAAILFLPTMVVTFAGGAFFGPVLGTVVNLLGATLGAALSFLISRHFARDWVVKKRSPKMKRLILGVEKKGWVFVAFLRLFPIVPFHLVNYSLGITQIKFRLYLVTTFIFLIPAEIVYTYCGYVGMDVLSKSGDSYKSTGLILTALAIVFLCVIKLTKYKKSQPT